MNTSIISITIISIIRAAICALSLFFPVLVSAAGDITSQKPVDITINLGNKANQLRFEPSTINLETGKLYKLKIVNPSTTKHYFSSAKMAASVFTRKVQINDSKGKAMVEVKGSIREIEVYPGHSAEWWFVPIKNGTFDDLHCSIKGHTEAGMKGSIVIR